RLPRPPDGGWDWRRPGPADTPSGNDSSSALGGPRGDGTRHRAEGRRRASAAAWLPRIPRPASGRSDALGGADGAGLGPGAAVQGWLAVRGALLADAAELDRDARRRKARRFAPPHELLVHLMCCELFDAAAAFADGKCDRAALV